MKRVDPRIVRTKKLLIKSFKTLSNQKSFKDITVKDITERATVNRATFYYHFNDKNDLVEHIVDEELRLYLKNPLSNSKGINERTLRDIFLSLVQFYEALTTHCYSNYHFFKIMIDKKATDALIEQMYQLLGIEESDNPFAQPHLSASLISWALYGLMNEWTSNQGVEPEQLIIEASPSLLASLKAGN